MADLEDQQTSWPKVIGVISLIYALIGLMCAVTFSAVMGFADAIPEMFRGGAEFPLIVRVLDGGGAVINFFLGLLMVTGAINLLRRRRAGVRQLKRWVVLRMLLAIVGIGGTIATLPQRMEMTRGQLEFQNEMLERQGRADMQKEITDERVWSTVRRGLLFTPLPFVFPTFLGFYLSRRRIDDEIRGWD